MIVTLDSKTFFSQSELRRMKLSAKQIRALGAPDETAENPYEFPGRMFLYAKDRVEAIAPGASARATSPEVWDLKKGRSYTISASAPWYAVAIQTTWTSRKTHAVQPTKRYNWVLIT